jgi:hypothetical protein
MATFSTYAEVLRPDRRMRMMKMYQAFAGVAVLASRSMRFRTAGSGAV